MSWPPTQPLAILTGLNGQSFGKFSFERMLHIHQNNVLLHVLIEEEPIIYLLITGYFGRLELIYTYSYTHTSYRQC